MAINSSNPLQSTTPVVLNLIIINALVFFAQAATGGLDTVSTSSDLFALHHYASTYFKPYQVITYMFMHGSFSHLLFNMFGLWMFGVIIERDWGPKRFIIFYFICGIGAAIFQLASYAYQFWPADHNILSPELADMYQTNLRAGVTVGASGAIMGILAAFGYMYPNLDLYLMFIPIPIKAKWAILGIFAYDIFGGIARNDNVAHFAHIGGGVVGFIIVLIWYKKNRATFY